MTFPSSIFPRKGQIDANYDWVDLTSATGFILFDGVNCIDSGGDNYTLIESGNSVNLIGGSDYSEIGFTKMTSANGDFGDYDFDSSIFQLPRTIEGTATVRVGVSGDSATGINAFNCTVKLRKWDGSSETEIASVTSESATLSANENESYTMNITVPKTLIKKGEQIRATVVFNSTTTGQNPLFGHDPSDSGHTATGSGNLDSGNSRFLIAVPFKLDFL